MTLNLMDYSLPVIPAECVGNRPRRVWYFDTPVVLFRDGDGKMNALVDRCPHRGAPLSEGKVTADGVQCPYHGWTFNGEGVCTRVPGLIRDCKAARIVNTFSVQENHGFIWLSPQAVPEAMGYSDVSGLDSLYFFQYVSASLQDILENFLDGFHTHFVHAGWIRRDAGRQCVRATRVVKDNSVEIIYSEEGKQNGFFSSVFEGSRGKSIGRYLAPVGAEIEYRDTRDRISLIASLGVCPAGREGFAVSLRVATRRITGVPLWLKRGILSPLIKAVLKQDRTMIALVHDNLTQGASSPFQPLDTELDLMAPAVRLGLAGNALSALPDVCVELAL